MTGQRPQRTGRTQRLSGQRSPSSPVRVGGKSKSSPPPASVLRAYPAPTAGGGPRSAVAPWELVIAGDLTEKQVDLELALVEVPRGSRGTIYLDSCGGSAFVGLALATLIRVRQLRATAIVVGECSSAALMPFAACHERFVTRYSTMLFHPIRWQSEEHVRLEEAVEWARHFRVMEVEQDELLARLLGCSVEQLQTWCRPGRFLTGPELVEAGLAKLIEL